jgi:predicted AlkP superfamily phosphohydrolase/phosphomutase
LDHESAKRTGLAWEHFSTGLDPVAAGRWSAVNFNPQTYQCRQKGTSLIPFPAQLSEKTVIFDVPYFDLVQAPNVKGMVSWGSHDPGTKLGANPLSLLKELECKFGPYPAKKWIYGFAWPSADKTQEMGRALQEAVDLRAKMARWLLAERLPEWSLGMVVVSELHSAIEALWHGIDPDHPLHGLPSSLNARNGVEATYQAVDQLVSSLVNQFPDVSVLVFSMHGMGPNESDIASMALLPELLFRRQFGYPLLQCSPGSEAHNTRLILLDEHEVWKNFVTGLFPDPPITSPQPPPLFKQFLPGLKRLLFRNQPKITLKKHASNLSWMPAMKYSDHWSSMDAFALPSFYDGQIRVNLKGRESMGRIRLDQYEDFCCHLERELIDLKDPRTEQRAVKEIIRNRRTNPTEFGCSEADITIVWEGSPLAFQHPIHGIIGPLPFRRTGGHTGDHGIAIFHGHDISPGFYGKRSAFDVVPTIIEYVEGKTIPGISGTSMLREIKPR